MDQQQEYEEEDYLDTESTAEGHNKAEQPRRRQKGIPFSRFIHSMEILPTNSQLSMYRKQLWWLAFESFEEASANQHSCLWGAWLEALHSNKDERKGDQDGSELGDQKVAQATYTRFLESTEMFLQKFVSRLEDYSNMAVKSVERISEILQVMQSTLKFKTGGLAWVCFMQGCIQVHSGIILFPKSDAYAAPRSFRLIVKLILQP